jgi:Na+-transporting NADH:ubiquinone oxidoreductase subunit NqrF
METEGRSLPVGIIAGISAGVCVVVILLVVTLSIVTKVKHASHTAGATTSTGVTVPLTSTTLAGSGDTGIAMNSACGDPAGVDGIIVTANSAYASTHGAGNPATQNIYECIA